MLRNEVFFLGCFTWWDCDTIDTKKVSEITFIDATKESESYGGL
jgi:hypothetical protein